MKLTCTLVVVLAVFTTAILSASIPVIIDTDIGNDCDDSWAIALAVSSPEFDVKMILSATYNTYGRAQIIAKYLQEIGRTEIPVGIGISQNDFVGPLFGWAQDYNLSSYPGKVYKDGVQAAIDIISNSSTPVTVIAIAPTTNIGEMLNRNPAIVKNVNIVAMSGDIHSCMINSTEPCPEFNAATNITASQAMYAADWLSIKTTPIDTCGIAILSGANYQLLLASNTSSNPVVQVLLEEYVYWRSHGGWAGNPTTNSSVLFDTVAVYMSYSDCSFCDMQELNLVIDSLGATVKSNNGKPVDVCLSWAYNGNGLEGWADELTLRLVSN